eukprot:CAMPEP_0183353810 /NCGR_PEP_ID=MMETSP0164_2-20130417/35188_1 /TAXON_ID=221442 /ORGANISM="Coccolithus pelagicus ssp braarudi, Strain PLY182g" /LENGTH=223 /DNA_ID=CAMNT_0025526567 /DNA_START=74 /DNA_END=745 /DNA_ORIENTATION=+
MADESLGMELKLYDIFPTVDRETIHAVCSHHAGDAHAAMLQLIELLGNDEEALEITFALMQTEEVDELAYQLAQDEQLALALQQEFAAPEQPVGAASKPVGAARKKSNLSTEARALLIKFGKFRVRTGAHNTKHRLLDPGSMDSAEVEEEPLTDAPTTHWYSPSRPAEPSLSLDEQSTATGVRTGSEAKATQYNERLRRARTSRQSSISNDMRKDQISIMGTA